MHLFHHIFLLYLKCVFHLLVVNITSNKLKLLLFSFRHYWTWVTFLICPMKLWVPCLLSVLLCSQYTSLWSVSNSPMTAAPQNGGTDNNLGSQFLRGSGAHYHGLTNSATAPSSGSPMYDSSAATEVHDAAQYDSSPHGRLPSVWTPVTPPSLWWKQCSVCGGCLNCCRFKGGFTSEQPSKRSHDSTESLSFTNCNQRSDLGLHVNVFCLKTNVVGICHCQLVIPSLLFLFSRAVRHISFYVDMLILSIASQLSQQYNIDQILPFLPCL